MRIIGFGELEANLYFKNKIFQGINNGNEISLILANLASSFNTSFYGYVGNDFLGKLLLEEFDKLSVNTDNIEIINKHTIKNFIDNNKVSIYCPFCDRVNDSVYEDYIFDSNVDSDDIFIVNRFDRTIKDNYNNKKYLYLNNTDYVVDLDYDEILTFKNEYEIIYLSKEVYLYLKEKFLIDSLDIYEILSPKLLFIFKDKTGIDIIFNSEFTKKENSFYKVPVDISGSKEILFSEFIKYIIGKDINDSTISRAFINGITKYNYVSSLYGSLVNIKPLINNVDYISCICKNIIDK